MEIKDNLVVPERAKCLSQGATYFGIVLSNLLEIIDTFVDINPNQVLLQS